MSKQNLKKIIVGPFEVNCYILTLEDDTFIIDPGAESEKIINFIKQNLFLPVQVLFTHAHIDHISAVYDIVTAFNIPVYLNNEDTSLYFSPINSIAPFYPPLKKQPHPINTAVSGKIEILHTPGHTPGGVCFYVKEYNLLFSGDTIFQGSVGRTDLPSGNHSQLIQSIKTKILTLPDDTLIYPGHGPATDVGVEKQNNPFL